MRIRPIVRAEYEPVDAGPSENGEGRRYVTGAIYYFIGPMRVPRPLFEVIARLPGVTARGTMEWPQRPESEMSDRFAPLGYMDKGSGTQP